MFARYLFAVVLAVPLAAAEAAGPPLEVAIRDHVFVPAELHVKAGQAVVLQVTNQDATAEEFESSALKVEKLLAGHGTALLRLRPLAAGRYDFVGEYHEATAHGVLVAE